MVSDKVHPHHSERKALLFVRHSSAHQVSHNHEERHAAICHARSFDRARLVGDRRLMTTFVVLLPAVSSAPASSGRRAVCLGKVGAVAAREISRFARNGRDWRQLIEMCRMFDTMLIDQETIYAPRHGNDRLLLVSRQPERVRA